MTPNNTHGKHYSNKLLIRRYKDYELDEAIENLEGRNYELVDRGVDKLITSKKYWARMKKIEVTV